MEERRQSTSEEADHRREIFCLDDDEALTKYMSLQLSSESDEFEHFDVSTFTEPYGFMQAVQAPEKNSRLVLVIIDYLLEGPTHGFMVAERVSRNYPEIAQLFCTSHTNAKVFKKICTSPACARNYLEKPISQGTELRKVVEETLSFRDEFFTRFAFKEEFSPFVIPRLPRMRMTWKRRKEDQIGDTTPEKTNE